MCAHPRGDDKMQYSRLDVLFFSLCSPVPTLFYFQQEFFWTAIVNCSALWPRIKTTMQSNGFSKRFYRVILFASLLNVCAVQAVVKFVDDPQQRKLCQANKKNACSQDKKCAWQDVLRVCNEYGYQLDVQHCNAIPCPGQDWLRPTSSYILWNLNGRTLLVRTINSHSHTYYSRMYLPSCSERRIS